MKKILTASLVAMMAVTAARADIASTTYVDTKATAAQTAAETTAAGALTAAKTELEGKITAEETRATGVESGFATRIQALEAATGDGEGSVLADAKAYTDEVAGTTKTAYETYADQAEADAIAAAAEAAKIYIDDAELAASQTAQDTTLKAYADDAAGAVSTALGEYKTTNDAAVKKVGDDLAAETLRATGVEGGFATRIQALEAATGDGEGSVLADAKAYTDQQVDAEETARDAAIEAASAATKTAYEAADAALKSAYEAADALKADKTALEAEVTRATGVEEGLQNAIDALEASNAEGGANAAAIAEAKKAGTDAQTYAEGVNTALSEYKTTNDAAVVAAQTAADTAQDEVDALEGVVSGKQPKSEKLSLGAADGAWVDLTSATANYQTTGTYSLTLVNGTPYWTEVK